MGVHLRPADRTVALEGKPVWGRSRLAELGESRVGVGAEQYAGEFFDRIFFFRLIEFRVIELRLELRWEYNSDHSPQSDYTADVATVGFSRAVASKKSNPSGICVAAGTGWEHTFDMAAHTIPAEELARSVYVTEEEYLRTSYRPDCDYIDGRLEERNAGEYEHSGVQTRIRTVFENHRFDWGVKVKTDCRLQVSPNNYRVPDVTVLRLDHAVKRIVREAPLICIEVLSPEDTWARLRERLNEHLAMGVANVWCFDPETREVRTYTTNGFNLVMASEVRLKERRFV